MGFRHKLSLLEYIRVAMRLRRGIKLPEECQELELDLDLEHDFKYISMYELACYYLQPKEIWSEQLDSFINEFNGSKRIGNLIFCKKYPRLSNDDVNWILNKVMAKLGYTRSFTIEDKNKVLYYTWIYEGKKDLDIKYHVEQNIIEHVLKIQSLTEGLEMFRIMRSD
jgi:hypothetical protein